MKIKIDCGGAVTTGLLLLFVALKLLGVIDWSWFWVLSPLWISIVLAVLIIGVILIIVWRQND